MIQRLMGHLRGNAVAYVALFVALGGTSYAATSLPRDSVGTKQLRNGAVTPAKLSKGTESVAAITVVNAGGTVLPSLSTPEDVKTTGWSIEPSGQIQGTITYPRRYARSCTPIATASSPGPVNPSQAPAVVAAPEGLRGFSTVAILDNNETDVTVVVLCPSK